MRLEILKDRFGAVEAVANSSSKLARYAPEDELAMDLLVAESVLEFGRSLREARDGAMEWAQAAGGGHRLHEDRTAAAGKPAAIKKFFERLDDTGSTGAAPTQRRRAASLRTSAAHTR
jgi:hypothetical protein